MSDRENEECAECGEPTELKGWVFTMREGEKFSLDGLVKEERPWCRRHFIEHMFSLWPFSCTDECREAQCDLLGIELEPEDTWVWINLGAVLVVDEDVPDDTMPGAPMKPRSPFCPWCQKPMQILQDKNKRRAPESAFK